jgi:hypothetical protein
MIQMSAASKECEEPQRRYAGRRKKKRCVLRCNSSCAVKWGGGTREKVVKRGDNGRRSML